MRSLPNPVDYDLRSWDPSNKDYWLFGDGPHAPGRHIRELGEAWERNKDLDDIDRHDIRRFILDCYFERAEET